MVIERAVTSGYICSITIKNIDTWFSVTASEKDSISFYVG